jgi:hypothetical protein
MLPSVQSNQSAANLKSFWKTLPALPTGNDILNKIVKLPIAHPLIQQRWIDKQMRKQFEINSSFTFSP